ncbi:type II toxin-antitoxin system mRNA interferase toxin, RelE/StbE family [Candidatus Poribacteria bacterium]|nr:MAG: type II toxin-antitoxin system mRNA interferase toxin, RelE/StbE family [Candidatus Poribacteria bacterium]
MYELILTRSAEQDLQRLDDKIRRQIHNRLEWLRVNCDKCSHKALKGNYKGQFKLRSGDYRAIYTYNKQTTAIEVSRIRHRSSVYE